MLRRLSVRGKILATLAVPILVLVFAAVFISAQSLREVQVARAITGALGALQNNRVYIEALQTERQASVLHAGEIRLERRLPFLEVPLTADEESERAARAAERAEDYATATANTQSTMTRSQDRMREINFGLLDPFLEQAFDGVIEASERLPDVRASVESGNLAPNLVDRQYSVILREVLQLPEQFAGTIEDRTLGTYLNANALVDQTVDNIANERGFGFYALEGDGQEASARDHLVGLFPETTSAQARARQAVLNLGNDGIEMPDWGAQSEAFTDFSNLRSRLQTSALPDWAAVSENTWLDQATIEIDALDPTRASLWSAVQRNAAAAQSAALSQATLTILIAIVALAASVVIALLVGRTITSPLRRLTAAAGEVRDQLPRLVEQVSTPGEGPDLTLMQIPVESTDEIGHLATAFNEVNQTTVEVAQEQAALRGSIAEMFVNVARRDQVLLNRQLSFIDTLEREEEDPNTLANLFRLDHLATRMRRNAESLLVLAGIDSGRRVRGSMTLSDVVRTASSEIEQYDRINLQLGVDPHMHGFNSLPAAHLLAEIMENATVFSEPGTPVDVVTSAEIEFITVTVIDRGLGMSAEDIKDANQRIRQSGASDVIGAQRLGLHVVGRLATRLGTKVVFARADGAGGTQVRVRFPRALFVENAEEAQPSSGGRVLAPAELGEAAPEVKEVDLEALTDGETGLGLPRRRASDAPAPATGAPSSAPAPAAPAAASAPPQSASTGLPSRRNFVLPEVATPSLAPDVAAAAAAGWSPAVAAPNASGLPSRAKGASAGAMPVDDGPVAPPRPAATELAPEQRSGMFSGFRRGTDVPEPEPTAAPDGQADGAGQFDGAAPDAITHEAGSHEAVPHEAGAHDAGGSLPSRSAQQFVVPGLAPEDDEAAASPADLAPEPVAPAPEVEPAQWSPAGGDAPYEEFAPEQPVGEAPAASWPQAAPQAPPSWSEPSPYGAEQPAASWDGAPPSAATPVAPSAPTAPSWGEPDASAPQVPTWEEPAEQAPAAPSVPAPAAWGPADPAWSPADVGQHYAPPSSFSPAVEPEVAAPAAFEQTTQYPAFSPDAGYAAPAPASEPAAAWPAQAQPVPELSPDPVPAPPAIPEPAHPPAAVTWSPSDPAQPLDWNAQQPAQPYAQPQSDGAPGWLAAGAPQAAAPAAPSPQAYAPAAAPVAPQLPPVAPVAPTAALPTFSDLVGQDAAAPTRRSRRGGPADPTKLSRGERRAAKRAEAKAKAEEKSLAKAEARAAKKSKGKSAAAATPVITPAEADAPATGFFSQPTSIAALRASDAPSAPTPAPASPAWSTPEHHAEPAPAQAQTPAPAAPSPAASSWEAPTAAFGAFEPQQSAQASFEPAFQPRQETSPQPAVPTPTPAPEPPALATRASSGSTSFSPAPAAWTPGGADGGGAGARQFGVLDDEVAAMLALRSDIQEQALSELSQLSAYRPQVVKPAASLTRRTPTAIPSAPEMEAPTGPPVERDAEELRSRLSSFQSGATRGRRVKSPPTDSAPSTDGAAPQANGSAEHAAPEAPPADSSQEAQTW